MSFDNATWDDLDRDQRIKVVTELAAEKFSAADIAHELKTTKNAVMGMASRNGIRLMGKPGYAQQAEAKPKPAQPKSLPRLFLPFGFDHAPMPLTDLTSQSCRWPVDTEKGTMFCGLHTERVYCEAHQKRAYRSPESGV